MWKVLVMLPAFNEEKTISEVLDNTDLVRIKDVSFKTLVIDDGSTDATAALALAHGAQVLSHAHNRGVGAAFQTGLREAILQGFDILVSIDSDGQFDPAHIPVLIAPILERRADFVTASRFENDYENEVPPLKRWGNRTVSKLVSFLTHHPIKDASCGFRAYSRTAFLNLNLIGNFTYTHETILNLAFRGYRLLEVPIPVRGTREYGQSRVASNLFYYAMQSLLIMIRCYRDYRPMALFGIPGTLLVVFGLLSLFIFLGWSIISGSWYPKSVAFSSAFLLSTGFVFLMIALVADMFTRQRTKTEFLLQYLDSLSANGRKRESTDAAGRMPLEKMEMPAERFKGHTGARS